MMEYSREGLLLTEKFEGLRLQSYQDSVGKWTIGYGHTTNVRAGDVITKDMAQQYLVQDIHSAMSEVIRLVKVPLTQGQFDALVDFTFNLGSGSFQHSTLLGLLNAKNYSGAQLEFYKWNLVGGKVSQWQVSRRKAEADLFSSPTIGNFPQASISQAQDLPSATFLSRLEAAIKEVFV